MSTTIYEAHDALCGAVIAYGKGISPDDPVVRKAVAKALGLKRLRAARFEPVLEKALSTSRIELRDDKLYPIYDKRVESAPKTEKPTETHTPPAPPKRPKQYMGRLLESRLNTLSKDMPEGRATATFCHCPNCGVPLLLEGAVRVAND